MAIKAVQLVMTYTAWDTSSQSGATGDAGNHTLRLIRDGVPAVPTNAPVEVDAVFVKGSYSLLVTAAEMTVDSITLGGVSSTPNVSIIPQTITTEGGVLTEVEAETDLIQAQTDKLTFTGSLVNATVQASGGGGGGGPGGPVLSSASSYLSPTELLKRVDIRYVADLLGDKGARIGCTPPSTDPDPTIVIANVNLIACLNDASGELEAHVILGGRYTPVDLAILAGMTQARMFRILTTLTIVYLIQRRPDLNRPMPFMWKQTQDDLAALAQGEQIFGLQNVADAGRIAHYTEVAADVENRDLASFQARRYLGRRSNRDLGPGRWSN